MSTPSPTILAFGAHPDDVEFRCGGLLRLLARQGWTIHVATASIGNCGSKTHHPNEISRLRRTEATAAAAKLGGAYHCLNGLDLQIYDNDEMRAAACALIREVQPDFIITHFPVDYMADHEAASAIMRTASFVAPMPNYLVGPAAALPPTPELVPLYYFGGPLGGVDYAGTPYHPHFYLDITSVIEEKAEALACHASQRDWLRAQHGIDQYLEEMRHWDAEAGNAAGVPYAEGFFIHKGHAYPQTPVIQEALAEYLREGRE